MYRKQVNRSNTVPTLDRALWQIHLTDKLSGLAFCALDGWGFLKNGFMFLRREIDVAGTKSFMARPGKVEQRWWLVDASGHAVGRLASEIATILMGKHRPSYTPHVDTGDFVVVINAGAVTLSGNKWENKQYTWYTGHPGLRSETAATRLQRQPEQILREAIRRMLPKNKLGRAMLGKLKIYAAAEHPHQAQNPEKLDLATKN